MLDMIAAHPHGVEAVAPVTVTRATVFAPVYADVVRVADIAAQKT